MSDYRQEAEIANRLRDEMMFKLAKNRHKTHWLDSDLSYLIDRLDDEVAELKRDPSWEEAADVANFAAMIADAAGWQPWTRRAGGVR
jgi:predicted house-cleaning noncanonical NTP pyrophosphatase (MazG superfamily)